MSDLQTIIDTAWDKRESVSPDSEAALHEAVEEAILLLDRGEQRVAEKVDGKWQVNQWLKKAVLLSFRLNPMATISGGPGGAVWWDKVDSKFLGWGDTAFKDAGFRAVPMTCQPASAYCRANSRPSPRLAPVTSTV